jgi:nitrile hydratase accessory protein
MSEMDLQGLVAPPMANGEVIFEAPWQSRVFGMARVLCEAGHYSWDEFRDRLIKRIEEWESHHSEQRGAEYPYFDCFLNALTDILESKGLCSTVDMSSRSEEFSARPHGHDH